MSTESEAKDESRHRRLLCLGDGVLVFWGVTPRWYGQCWDEPGVSSGGGRQGCRAESDGGRKHGVLTAPPLPELGRKGRAGREQQPEAGEWHSYVHLFRYWVGPKSSFGFFHTSVENSNKAFGQPSIFFSPK